jgi:hypothetical protein
MSCAVVKYGDRKEVEYFASTGSTLVSRPSHAVSFYPTLLFSNVLHTAILMKQPPTLSQIQRPTAAILVKRATRHERQTRPTVKLLDTRSRRLQAPNTAVMDVNMPLPRSYKYFFSTGSSGGPPSFSFVLILLSGDHTNALLPTHLQRAQPPSTPYSISIHMLSCMPIPTGPPGERSKARPSQHTNITCSSTARVPGRARR